MPQATSHANTAVSQQRFSAADFYRKLRQFGANPYVMWIYTYRADEFSKQGTVHDRIFLYTETDNEVPLSVYADAERLDPGRRARRRYAREQLNAAAKLMGERCIVRLGLPRGTPISQRIWQCASSDEVAA